MRQWLTKAKNWGWLTSVPGNSVSQSVSQSQSPQRLLESQGGHKGRKVWKDTGQRDLVPAAEGLPGQCGGQTCRPISTEQLESTLVVLPGLRRPEGSNPPVERISHLSYSSPLKHFQTHEEWGDGHPSAPWLHLRSLPSRDGKQSARISIPSSNHRNLGFWSYK